MFCWHCIQPIESALKFSTAHPEIFFSSQRPFDVKEKLLNKSHKRQVLFDGSSSRHFKHPKEHLALAKELIRENKRNKVRDNLIEIVFIISFNLRSNIPIF
jgi:hypothetical protein